MTDHTLRDRETIPLALKTILSSSLDMGESVLSVFVVDNDTSTWNDKERRHHWQKTQDGTMYPGVVSLIDHDKNILNVDFYDTDKGVGVPFNLVKRQDGQFCDEVVVLDKRHPDTKSRNTTRSKVPHPRCDTYPFKETGSGPGHRSRSTGGAHRTPDRTGFFWRRDHRTPDRTGSFWRRSHRTPDRSPPV